MKELKVIKEQVVLGKEFKIYGSVEEPLFLAKDVAEWIEYSKTSQGYYNTAKMLMTVDKDEKRTITNSNSGGKASYLTEDGLYEVLMQSRKPIAKAFKKEVKIILKTIRETGAYMTDMTVEKLLADPSLVIGLATQVQEEKEKNRQKDIKIEELEGVIIHKDNEHTEELKKAKGRNFKTYKVIDVLKELCDSKLIFDENSEPMEKENIRHKHAMKFAEVFLEPNRYVKIKCKDDSKTIYIENPFNGENRSRFNNDARNHIIRTIEERNILIKL